MLEVAARCPEDRLLVETDAPFLTPVPHRGKKNEPAYVVHTLERVAQARGCSAAHLDAVTTANTLRFFRWEA